MRRRAAAFTSKDQKAMQEEKLRILKRAKRGDRTAKKRLRQMGLLYWEHKGRVIVKRDPENGAARNGAAP
ncbi:MAG: hypothetical protein ACE5EP_01075, partial [Candidatus Methylomirabilales bacterium]